MSIKPLSDIVLDVARAAGPRALQGRRRGCRPPARPAVRRRDPRGGLSTHMPSGTPRHLTTLQNGAAATGPGAKAGGPYKQFEAFVLQNFIESMLPK